MSEIQRCALCSYEIGCPRDGCPVRTSPPLPTGEALRALVEKWRMESTRQLQMSEVSDARGDGANSHTERARARIYSECADELDALLTPAPPAPPGDDLNVAIRVLDDHDMHEEADTLRCRANRSDPR